jgi:hypothetical protein
MESRGCQRLFKKATTFAQIAHLTQYLQILIKVTPIESLWHNVIDVQLAFSLPTSLAAIAITNQDAFTYASPSLTV